MNEPTVRREELSCGCVVWWDERSPDHEHYRPGPDLGTEKCYIGRALEKALVEAVETVFAEGKPDDPSAKAAWERVQAVDWLLSLHLLAF